jgi:hypothetical protein
MRMRILSPPAATLALAALAACLGSCAAPGTASTPPPIPPDARLVEVCVLKEALAEFPVMTTASGIISLDIPGAPGDQMVPFTVADRAAVTEALVRVAEVDVRARMRIVTLPGALAEASVDRPGARTAVNVRVVESEPGTVEAWVGFEDADGYWLKPTWIRFREGEAFVLRLPGPTANLGERAVVITAGRRGEGPGC